MEGSPDVENPKNLKRIKLFKAIFFGFIILNLILFLLTMLFVSGVLTPGKKDVGSIMTFGQREVAVSPTPFPFQELTVPYLRQRSYQSSLGELVRVSDNSNYTGYLTSYDSDGFKVNGYLTIPKGTRPVGGFPGIIFIHGYIPPQSYQTLENYASYVDYLAQNGFVVFKIDLRGHADSEGEPGGGYYGSDYIVDALSAYAALQNTDFVNKEGIGLWGHSMAGNVVLRSLAAKPEIPAAVIWAGAVYSYLDWQKYGINDNSYSPPQTSGERQRRRQELFNRYGTPSARSVFWQQVAPTNFLNDLEGAIQLNHAADDSVVSVGYSRDLNALLDETAVVHQLNVYPSGGHNLAGNTFNQAMRNTVEFFRKHL